MRGRRADLFALFRAAGRHPGGGPRAETLAATGVAVPFPGRGKVLGRGNDVGVRAREVHRFVAIVPSDAVARLVVGAQDFEHDTAAATYVQRRRLDRDAVTNPSTHQAPFRSRLRLILPGPVAHGRVEVARSGSTGSNPVVSRRPEP